MFEDMIINDYNILRTAELMNCNLLRSHVDPKGAGTLGETRNGQIHLSGNQNIKHPKKNIDNKRFEN